MTVGRMFFVSLVFAVSFFCAFFICSYTKPLSPSTNLSINFRLVIAQTDRMSSVVSREKVSESVMLTWQTGNAPGHVQVEGHFVDVRATVKTADNGDNAWDPVEVFFSLLLISFQCASVHKSCLLLCLQGIGKFPELIKKLSDVGGLPLVKCSIPAGYTGPKDMHASFAPSQIARIAE